MKKVLILSLTILTLILINPFVILADHLPEGTDCTNNQGHCQLVNSSNEPLQCQPDPPSGPGKLRCKVITGASKTFGKVNVPTPLQNLGFGSVGISGFVNALIRLIYMLASVIFVFMLLWGAIEWLMSGGDKEKVQNAGKRLTNAIIGIILLAITFAILNLIGIFTGFTFFT